MAGAGDIRAGGAFVELFADSSGVVKGVDRAVAKIESWRVASERANRATLAHGSGMENSVSQAISLGKYMGAARIATEGMELAAALLAGDFQRAADELKQIPIVGRGATAGFGLGQAIGKALFGGGEEGDGGIGDRLEARRKLADITADAEKQADRTLMRDDVRRLAEREDRRKAEMAAVEELAKTQPIGAFDARAAVQAKYDAMAEVDRRSETAGREGAERRRLAAIAEGQAAEQAAAADLRSEEQADSMRQDMETEERQRSMDAASAEERKKIEADLADDIAQLQIETTQKGIDRRLSLLDLAWAKERQAAVDAGADVLAVRKKYDLLEAQARAEEAARDAVSIAATPVRGGTGATAAGIQALQTGPTFTKMENHLAAIERSNQRILAGGGPKF